MSAIPISPSIDLQIPTRPPVRDLPPVAEPLFLPPLVRTRPSSRSKTRIVNRIVTVLHSMFLLALLTMVTYLVSVLAGTVALEAANKDAARSATRALSADSEVSVLSRAVSDLRSDATIRSWAEYNGFTLRPQPKPAKP